jgi:hypothetical protein
VLAGFSLLVFVPPHQLAKHRTPLSSNGIPRTRQIVGNGADATVVIRRLVFEMRAMLRFLCILPMHAENAPRSVAEDSNVRLSGTAMTVRPWIYDEPV